MEDRTAHRRSAVRWTVGVSIVAVFLCSVAFWRHRSAENDPQPDTQSAQVPTVKAGTTQPQPLLFGVQQDDPEGYGGLKWGSSSKDGPNLVAVSTSDDGLDPIVEKIIGPPGGEEDSTFLPDTATAPVVRVLQRPDSNDIQYGFYRDKLAWASVKMQGAYSDVQGELDTKYPESVPYSAESMGDGGGTSDLWAGVNFKGRAYRRGKTNTRIYLLMMADRDGNQTGLWMTYIPSFCVRELRQAWWDAHNASEREKTAQANQKVNAVHSGDGAKIQ